MIREDEGIASIFPSRRSLLLNSSFTAFEGLTMGVVGEGG
jgi:hypothetical protein